MADPGLSAVAAEALDSSPTVLAAWERVKIAHAGQWQAGSALDAHRRRIGQLNELATDSLIVQVTNSNPAFTEDLAREVFGDSYNTYNTGLQASWTVTSSAHHHRLAVFTVDWKAAERSRAAQAVGVPAAAGLVRPRHGHRAVGCGDRAGAGERELTALVQLRYEGGEARGLDLLQQKQQLANTEAALPAARAAVDRTLWRLAALLGRDPSRTRAEDYRLPDRLPPAPALPGLGSPVDLLARRPDLAASVATAKAADLGRLSSWLGLAPAVTLSGNTGESGQMLGADVDEWTTWTSWSVTANATVPLFNGGRKLAAARGAPCATARRSTRSRVTCCRRWPRWRTAAGWWCSARGAGGPHRSARCRPLVFRRVPPPVPRGPPSVRQRADRAQHPPGSRAVSHPGTPRAAGSPHRPSQRAGGPWALDLDRPGRTPFEASDVRLRDSRDPSLNAPTPPSRKGFCRGGGPGRCAGLAVVLGLAGAGGLVAAGKAAEKTTPPEQVDLVEILEFQPASTQAVVHTTGTVVAEQRSVLAPEVSGRVTWVSDKLRPGGRFAAASSLARLDARDYEVAVDQARVAVEQARLELALEENRGAVAEKEWAILGSEAGDDGALARRFPTSRSPRPPLPRPRPGCAGPS